MDNLRAFEVHVNGKTFDYRQGKPLDIQEVTKFFQGKGFHVLNISNQPRHLTAILEKNGQKLFLKLAPTPGISLLTHNETKWNDEYNKKSSSEIFLVPKTIETGRYNELFYEIMTYCEGEKVSELDYDKIIDFSEHIQNLDIQLEPYDKTACNVPHTEWFVEKTKRWFEAIPQAIKEQYNIQPTFDLVKTNASLLACRPRHGDFVAWHMIKNDEKLILLDGEHAMTNGVEYYDICYFIQRVFSEEKKPESAKKLYEMLVARGYDKTKLQTVLAARAIGGFLDASLHEKPDYSYADNFLDFVTITS